MLDSYLKRQNRCLMVIMIIIMISMVWGTIFLLGEDCMILAIIHASTAISLILSIGGIMRANTKYIKQCDSIASIERAAFSFEDEEAVKVIDKNIPDLNFKFHRD